MQELIEQGVNPNDPVYFARNYQLLDFLTNVEIKAKVSFLKTLFSVAGTELNQQKKLLDNNMQLTPVKKDENILWRAKASALDNLHVNLELYLNSTIKKRHVSDEHRKIAEKMLAKIEEIRQLNPDAPNFEGQYFGRFFELISLVNSVDIKAKDSF